ncbi:protein CLEC16A homolog isoform X1 [Ischnura elegans]|uniref:protein CLEC16A homolog isoform X1 n=1 Tax=Ischnura elegans TaxID=197161 RepID=UPI001ED87AF1|nr:protein CLEC16A homolog isoform X1 [Ischnura elegans]
MFRSRSWFGGGLWKPKNPHSLEHLKYLYNVLSKNQVVSENNRGLLVETLRSIAEILIWGDQNDSSVFDFFLEKNMLSFFLKIMKQKCGSYVCVQLLQTLNILFENIRNETSLYYLLSNNHVNSIIVHKFDFSDEEVMAYYISFLKTLSLKLNTHTIHFFYNEHTNDFPLYTEAIKFFNHQESMVRIAVRTLTLNVYRVDDKSMLKFIGDKTAAPYFSNLVWFIGSHVLELDSCVRNDADHQSQNRLSDLVAEHLDHLHYLNDILCLEIGDLNEVLTDHLLNKLLIPLYVYSLTKRRRHSQLEDSKPHVSSVVSLFLLSQVFLIITHVPLVHVLAWIILNGDMNIFSEGASEKLASYRQGASSSKPGFAPPTETLEKSLETKINSSAVVMASEANVDGSEMINDQTNVAGGVLKTESDPQDYSGMDAENKSFPADKSGTDPEVESIVPPSPNANITDEEKEQRLALESSSGGISGMSATENISPIPIAQVSSLTNKPFLEAVFNALQCSDNDYVALFALCLLYALGHNQDGVNEELLDSVLFPSVKPETKHWYNVLLVERLIKIISFSCQPNCRIRLVTLELTIRLLTQLVTKNGISYLHDCHLAIIEGAKEESTALLRNFYKSEEIFLDMFEDEYNEMKKKPLNVEWLMMDSNILLPPTGTPMTGIEFSKRLPCGEVERARRAIRVFLLIRELSLTLRKEPETQLPLTNPNSYVPVNEVLDLNNSDLIACIVVTKDNQKIRRFLATDSIQLILVEPDTRRLGWGIAKFVGLLQDVEVTADKEDSRYLHITVHRPLSSGSTSRVPLLSAKFIFDDHIRCMAAKQRLTKGRAKARQKKMNMIAKLLDLPNSMQPCSSPPTSLHSLHAFRHDSLLRGPIGSGRLSRDLPPSGFMQQSPHLLHHHHYHHRPLFTVNRVPGFATAMRRSGASDTAQGVPSSLPSLMPPIDGVPAMSALSHLRAESLDRQQGNARSRSHLPVNGGSGIGSASAGNGSPGGNGTSVGGQAGGARSREGSPRPPRPRSEEIPLEDMSTPPSPSTVCSSPASTSGIAVCKHKPRSVAYLQGSGPLMRRRLSGNSPGLGVAVCESPTHNRIHYRLRSSSHPSPPNRKSPPASSQPGYTSRSPVQLPSSSSSLPSHSPAVTPSRLPPSSKLDGPSTSGASAPSSPSIPKLPPKEAETETSFMEMPLGARCPDMNGNPSNSANPENADGEARSRPTERALLAGRHHQHGEASRRKLRQKGIVETV